MSIVHGDCLEHLKTLESGIAQIIICDPPYNIGKNFGNNKTKLQSSDYLQWCGKWINECIRILKPNGSMFIYGFSEILSSLVCVVPEHLNKKWLVWHYTNKTVPSLNFWQRSHESILLVYKDDKVFNRDLVRVPYSDSYLLLDGKKRASTVGRFSDGKKETKYKVHPLGALPKDVIKVSSLAGKKSERVDHPTQKPLELCEILINSCKQKDGIILVPFAGSGSECVAAKKLGIDFIGIELNIDYIKIINERLADTRKTDVDEDHPFHSRVWSQLKSFSSFTEPMSQYEYYSDNNASTQVLKLVKLNSKVFGTICEKIIIELLGLTQRTSTQNDATYTYDNITYKFEIKVGRFLQGTDNCMWQHIEPTHNFNYVLLCLLNFDTFDIFYLSKDEISELIKSNKIKKQGSQGYICKKLEIMDYIHNLDKSVTEIFRKR